RTAITAELVGAPVNLEFGESADSLKHRRLFAQPAIHDRGRTTSRRVQTENLQVNDSHTPLAIGSGQTNMLVAQKSIRRTGSNVWHPPEESPSPLCGGWPGA